MDALLQKEMLRHGLGVSSGPEVQAYNLWYLATRGVRERAPDDPANARAEEIEGQIDRAYPGLRQASLAEQKRIGKIMVQDARGLADAAAAR